MPIAEHAPARNYTTTATTPDSTERAAQYLAARFGLQIVIARLIASLANIGGAR